MSKRPTINKSKALSIPVAAPAELARLRTLNTTAAATPPTAGMRDLAPHLGHSRLMPPGGDAAPAKTPATRPRLIFGVDATASREAAWEAAKSITDALVSALPGELDVALMVHGGSRVHTFTPFTGEAETLRRVAAKVSCVSGYTRLLPILEASTDHAGVRMVVYVGDVFEEDESEARGRADFMGQRGIKLIVLHDLVDSVARLSAEILVDMTKRTGGCVLPFDATSIERLRDLLAAIAVYAVGGEQLLLQRNMPGATKLLQHLHG